MTETKQLSGYVVDEPRRLAPAGALLMGEGTQMMVLTDTETNAKIKAPLLRAVAGVLGWTAAHRYDGSYPLTLFARNYEDITKTLSQLDFDVEAAGVAEIFTQALVLKKDLEQQVQENLLLGEVEYEDVPHVFTVGKEIYGKIEGEEIGGYIEQITRYVTFTVDAWEIKVRVVTDFYGGVSESQQKLYVSSFAGRRKIADLLIRQITPEVRERLAARGQIFKSVTNGASYVHYAGHLMRQSWRSMKSYRADGRVIIDAGTLQKIDDDQHRDLGYHNGLTDTEDRGEDTVKFILSDDDLWRCSPFVHGFSFAAKQWGRLLVRSLSPINWREDAFDKLVLADRKKKLVRSLVEHSSDSFSDIVEGKGGGVIFLLHGPPGEGKTLTAEAVAEILHRPLYSVSVGELGTNPEALENKLREVLDIATVWNAVILIDEADIFLEERDEKDIVRNAMVGVFLRLLEYHQGVLFLTTNRVKNIDKAFYSRISIALHFVKGDTDKRRKIWDNLLSAAKLDPVKLGLNVDRLASHALNGRQVKNIIRQSITLARGDAVPVSNEIMSEVIDLTTDFERELSGE